MYGFILLMKEDASFSMCRAMYFVNVLTVGNMDLIEELMRDCVTLRQSNLS